MKKLFYVTAAFAASLLLLSCGKKEPSSMTILQSTQWYDDDGGVWDIGMSFNKHYMWWDQTAECSVDQFLAPYVITTLSDGRVKLSPRTQSYGFFVLFSDITKESVKKQVVYLDDPYMDGFVQNEDGWAGPITELHAGAFKKLPWWSFALSIGGQNYILTSTVQDYGGAEIINNFRTEVTAGKEFPMVRMDNAGTKDDFTHVNVSGKVAVMNRGNIVFREKLENAASAGAVAAVCVDTAPGLISADITGVDPSLLIPFFICQKVVGPLLASATTIKFTVITDPGNCYQEE